MDYANEELQSVLDSCDFYEGQSVKVKGNTGGCRVCIQITKNKYVLCNRTVSISLTTRHILDALLHLTCSLIRRYTLGERAEKYHRPWRNIFRVPRWSFGQTRIFLVATYRWRWVDSSPYRTPVWKKEENSKASISSYQYYQRQSWLGNGRSLFTWDDTAASRWSGLPQEELVVQIKCVVLRGLHQSSGKLPASYKNVIRMDASYNFDARFFLSVLLFRYVHILLLVAADMQKNTSIR